MKNIKPLPQRSEQGFTLIELIVVIVIIGVLAAIALPIFLNQQKSSQAAAAKSDLRNAVTSMMTESTKTGGKFPGTLPPSTTTSEGIQLSLSQTGPLANNPALSQSVTAANFERLPWVEFEQLIGMNTGQSKVYIPEENTTFNSSFLGSQPVTGDIELYFFFPKTGGSLQAFQTFINQKCVDAVVVSMCNTAIPSQSATAVWERSNTNNLPITIAIGVSSNQPGKKVVSNTDINSHLTSSRLGITKLTGTENGILHGQTLSLPRSVPNTASFDPTIYGEPVRPGDSTDTFCINATHKDITDIAYHYNSETGKIAEGKC